MHDWFYLLADLATNKITAEVPLTGVSMTKVINGAGTFNADLILGRLGSASWDPYTVTTPAKTAIYAYRDGVPWWGGILWTRRYSKKDGTVQLGAADFWSYYDHRKVVGLLDTTDGATAIGATKVTYNNVDQNTIARNLIALAHTHTGGDLGVVLPDTVSGVPLSRIYYGYSLQNVSDALTELTGIDGGVELRFDVAPPIDQTNHPTRMMLAGTPLLGNQSAGWVFEDGNNLLDVQWASDGSSMATREWAVGAGSEASSLISVYEDTGKYDDGWMLTEAEGNGYSSIQDPVALLAHAKADQAAVRVPQAVITLVINGDLTPGLSDFSVGDTSRVIVKDAFFRRGIDTTMRIAQISIQPGNAAEQPQLIMNAISDDVA